MSDYGERLGKDTIRFERLLPGPIETVWAYVTDGDKRALWLAAGDTDLDVGGIVRLEFHNASLSPLPDDAPPARYADLPERMSFSGRVTRCEPMTLFAHTWDYGKDNSEVEYVLKEEGDKVRLTLTHRLLPDDDQLISASGGWHTHLDILVAVLDGETPKPFWRTHTALEAEYEERLT